MLIIYGQGAFILYCRDSSLFMARGHLFCVVGTVPYLYAIIMYRRACLLSRGRGHLYCTVGTVRYLLVGDTHSVLNGMFVIYGL